MPVPLPRRVSAIRRFLNSQASSGIILMAAAALAPLIANSPLREAYAHLLHIGVGSLSLGHAINDGLMAIFFLLVGLEIKREMLDGQLSSWPRRLLPGIAALGGTICPALVYLAFNRGGAVVRWCGGAVAGWAIPAAADIAFALAVIMLVGDDRRRAAGPHHPLQRTPARSDCDGADSPLHRLEHRLHGPVGFVILPLFGLANAGVPILGLPAGALLSPVTLGVGVGLLLGKVVGVFGMTSLAVRFGLADRPAHASQSQLFGMALLCGIGFTMSIFITLLAFPGDPLLQAEAKIGVLME